VLDLQVKVFWNGTRQFATDNALINYPTHGVQTLGFLAVQLTNSSSDTDNYGNLYPTRVQSVPVTIIGTNPVVSAIKLYPDSNGCVFTEANPGAYTIAVSDPSPNTPTGSNYRTPQFVANLASQPTSPPLTPVTVATGKTSSVQYQYDESSPVQVNYSVNGVVQTGSIAGIPLTVYNANLSPSTYWNIYTLAGHALAATTLPGLYPFTDGYSVFAGDCASESTTPGVVPITTAPGGSTSVTVPLASVTINVTGPLAVPIAIPGASVSLVANGSGCPADTYLFATTNSAGNTNTLLVPFGSYTLKITLGALSFSVPLVMTNVNSGVPIPELTSL
jgi:hypothetical protein